MKAFEVGDNHKAPYKEVIQRESEKETQWWKQKKRETWRCDAAHFEEKERSHESRNVGNL